MALLDDLEEMDDNIYKKQLKEKIDKMLGSFTINMDPANYRRLYRDKAFRETLNLPSTSAAANAAVNTSTLSHYNVRESSGFKSEKFNQTGNSMLQKTAQPLTQKQIQNMAAPATSMGLD